jgi:tellurite resistance protein
VKIIGAILGLIAFASLGGGEYGVTVGLSFLAWFCYLIGRGADEEAVPQVSPQAPTTSIPRQPSPRTHPLEVSIQEGPMGTDPDSPLVWNVRLRGSVPQLNHRLSLWTSVLHEEGPCVTSVSQYHEPTTSAYLHARNIGQTSGWKNWTRIGVVIPEILQLPRGGQQTVTIVTRLIASANPPPLEFGMILDQSHPGLIWAETTERRHTFSGKGYKETAEEGPVARALAVRIAVAIAFADKGGFSMEEASTIHKWMTLQLRSYEGQPGPRGTFKELLNDTFKEAHALGNIGKQGRKRLARRLVKTGEKTDHYRAMALCIDVMVSDRVADSNELQAIREIAESLSLDPESVQDLLYTRTTQLDLDTEQGSAEDFLGIDPEWDKKKICKSIRTQYGKANDDLMVLEDKVQRRNVQRQLDALAVLHKKYKC